MISVDLGTAKCLHETCQIRKLVFPMCSKTHSKHSLADKEIGKYIQCKGLEGDWILR